MAKKEMDLRDELHDLRVSCGLVQKVDCTPEENKVWCDSLRNGRPVPDDLYQYIDGNDQPTGTFYMEKSADLTPEERLEYIRLLQLKRINIIKNCVLYFTIVSIASAVLALLCALIVMGS